MRRQFCTPIMSLLFFLTITLFSTGCLPSPATRSTKSIVIATATPTVTPTAIVITSENALYWYTSVRLKQTLILDPINASTAELRGDLINLFLTTSENFKNSYCLVFDFNQESQSSVEQLRVRAIPIHTEKSERILRIEWDNASGSVQNCNGSILNYNNETVSTTPEVIFEVSKTCPGCSLSTTSVQVRLYQSLNESGINNSSLIDSDTLDISPLLLVVNPEDDVNNEEGTCIDSDCVAKGFNCCSKDKQCIKDGQEKPNASEHEDYEQAKHEVEKNPALFTEWPEIFYSCTNEKLPTPTPTVPPSADEEAQAKLQFLKELYYCLLYKEGEEESDNYCKPNYESVKNTVWDLCGCATVGTPAPEDPENTCPTYGFEAYNENNQLLSSPTAGHLFTHKLGLNIQNKQTKVYLRGSDLHAFLGKNKNDEKNFCLVLNYSLGASSTIRQLRLSAQAITFPAYPADNKERGLSIVAFDNDDAKVLCGGTVNNISASSEIAYQVTDVCPSCSSTQVSTSMGLYYSQNGTVSDANKVSINDLTFDALQLHLNSIDIGLTPDSTEELFWFTISGDKIKNIQCRAKPQTGPQDVIDTYVSLSGRTAPHRYFLKSNGVEVPDISTLKGSPEPSGESLSEGENFDYIDQINKLSPIQSPFSMKAILGDMRVDLTMAVPATLLQVAFDEIYIISTVEGDYTPCPMCARDSWFESFSPFPPSRFGTGVQSIGYSTSPDSWSGNYSAGNFEDTHFGRACWIPPTMIPFSHQAYSDVPTQRMTRLQTQSALYINGYKRDWFGFNQGALIGSFNGVNWFAIGKNRRVRATSTKLFLAINAPYADLSAIKGYKVHIMRDNGLSQVPELDFNPELDPSQISMQNEAGSCQRFHFCSSDEDCITRLGWEYMCSKVTPYRTLWPKFDKYGMEKANSSVAGGFSKVIHGNYSAGGAKRCVYRGAGAPCVKDYSKVTDPTLRKLFTCAPNYYCADLSDSAYNEVHNREPNNLGTILYGQAANVLGRPKNYLGDKNLTSEIISNLTANAAIQYQSLESEIGLCRPGKYLSYSSGDPEPLEAHQRKDPSQRTDYILQIAACNSDANQSAVTDVEKLKLALKRVQSCPVLDREGNYYYTQIRYDDQKNEVTTYPSTLYDQILAQNACGAESMYEGVSLFDTIESNSLGSLFALSKPSLARDGCQRRAGSICHTDYDCSPNTMHAQAVQNYPDSYFGGNEAEYNYWQENLTCEQVDKSLPSATPTPSVSGDPIKERRPYGRCCREVGGTFTMYTEGDINTEELNPTLKTSPSSFAIKGPRDEGRYSRYTIIPGLQTTEPATTTTPVPVQPKVIYTPVSGVAGEQRPLKFQWKTIHDTGQKSCCSGWIRKFANDSYSWLSPSYLNFILENFKCLNYRYFLPESIDPPLGLPINSSIFEEEKGMMCMDPANKGCAHYLGDDGYGFAQSRSTIVPPKELRDSACTSYSDCKIKESGGIYSTLVHSYQRENYLHEQAPFPPRLSPRIKSLFSLDTCKSCTFVDLEVGVMSPVHRQLILEMPSYINGVDNIMNIYLSRQKIQSSTSGTTSSSITFQTITEGAYQLPMLYPPGNLCPANIESCINDDNSCPFIGARYYTDDLAPNYDNAIVNDTSGWCYDATKGLIYIKRHICHSIPELEDATTGRSCETNRPEFFHDGKLWENSSAVIIEFKPMGFKSHSNGGSAGVEGLTPGNDLYYLEKLSRFELLGVPQIYYSPLYCNNNRNNLLPGIFDVPEETRTGFESISFKLGSEQKEYNGTEMTNDASIYSDSSLNNGTTVDNLRVVLNDKVLLPDIFSSYEFRCCKRLGSTTKDYRLCCSGFGVYNDVNQLYTCKLPLKTNLNVYFNRFISGEGSYSDLSSTMRLLDEDFDPHTGFPKLLENKQVVQKLIQLGKQFCSSGKVFTGAAFGKFGPRPMPYAVYSNEPSPYGIVYGPNDAEVVQQTSSQSVEGARGFIRFNDGRRWNHHLYCGQTP